MFSSKGLNPQCQHPNKYEISTDGDPVPELAYPSRLGFFHVDECGAVIHYVDIHKKFCRSCCDSLVPNGEYLVWSVLDGASAANVVTKLATLLPGDGHLPPIIEAGSELKDTSQSLALPIPDIAGAKQALEWLEAQAKPFYIDQLHILAGQRMSPLTRKRVAKDSLVAIRYGRVFNLDELRPASNVSTVQVAPAVADTQKLANSTLSVKEETKSKKSSTKKKLNEKNSEKKAGKKKSGQKASNEKAKKVRKEKQPAPVTEIVTFPEISSTKPRASKSSTVLLEPAGTISEALSKTRKTQSTNSVEAPPSIPTAGSHSTPSLATESKPLIPSVSSAATESPSISDMKGAKMGVKSTSLPTTTAKTLTRSWGWSEPFEFTTAPKKVPAISDYERVAESRAPSQSIAKSLDNFIEGHLKLDAPRKLLGPGDSKPIPASISGGASSSPSKRSSAPHTTEDKTVRSHVRGKDSSMKMIRKHSDEMTKPKRLVSESMNSGSSEIGKAAKSPEKTNGGKSNASRKTEHSNLSRSTKPYPEEISEHPKHKPHKDAPRTDNHRQDKTATFGDHPTHPGKSATSRNKIHKEELNENRTSNVSGNLNGHGEATPNHLEQKLNEATEKKPNTDKGHKEKPSKSHNKPQGHHSEKNESEPAQANLQDESVPRNRNLGVSVLPGAGTPGTRNESLGLPTATKSKGRVEPPIESTSKSLTTAGHPSLKSTRKFEPPDSKHKSQPKGWERLSGHSPPKGFGAGADPGVKHHDHKMPQKPKGTHRKKPGGQKVHGEPGQGSHAHQPRLAKPHAPKRSSGRGIAAGAVAGIAVGATLASLAGDSESDDDSESGSDEESNQSEVHGNDHESSSEGEEGMQPESDENGSSPEATESEHSQFDDSGPDTDDDDRGDEEDHSNSGGSDGDEETQSDAYVPHSDDESLLESDDSASNGGSDNEADDDDEDGSRADMSSESEGSGDDSDGEGDEDRDNQSESQPSGDEGQDSDEASAAADTSDSDENASNDEDHGYLSSGDEENSGGQDDDEDTDQDVSSDEEGSEQEEEESSEGGDSSSED